MYVCTYVLYACTLYIACTIIHMYMYVCTCTLYMFMYMYALQYACMYVYYIIYNQSSDYSLKLCKVLLLHVVLYYSNQ